MLSESTWYNNETRLADKKPPAFTQAIAKALCRVEALAADKQAEVFGIGEVGERASATS